MSQKKTSTNSLPNNPENDEEEEVIDTNTGKKEETVTGKRQPKPVSAEGAEEEKEAQGTIKEMLKEAEKDGDDENEFNMDEKDVEKMKENDPESEEDKVSLDEESVGELQKEEDFDVQDYLKFREKEQAS